MLTALKEHEFILNSTSVEILALIYTKCVCIQLLKLYSVLLAKTYIECRCLVSFDKEINHFL